MRGYQKFHAEDAKTFNFFFTFEMEFSNNISDNAIKMNIF